MRHILLFFLAVCVSACGDSEPGGAGGTGGSGSMLADQCDSADILILGEMIETIFDTSGTCAFGCLGAEEGISDCSSMCVADATGVSADCSNCFGLIVECIFENCATFCTNPDSADCTTCTDEAGCNEEFSTCSGVSVSGACQGDAAFLTEIAGTIAGDTRTCGLGCIDDEAGISECTSMCLIDLTKTKEDMISTECADCFGDLSECTITNCATPCLKFESEACQTCLVDEGCNSAFQECAGFPPDIAS